MEQLACGENRTQCWAPRSPLCQSCVRWSLQADIHFGVLSCCQGKRPACRQVAGAVRRPEKRSSAFPWKLLVTTMMSCIPKSGERRALFSRSLPLLKRPGTAQEPYRPNSCPALLVSPSLSLHPHVAAAPSPRPPALCNRSSVRAGCCRCFISPSPWQLASSSTRRDPQLLSAINQPPAFTLGRTRGHGSPWMPLSQPPSWGCCLPSVAPRFHPLSKVLYPSKETASKSWWFGATRTNQH